MSVNLPRRLSNIEPEVRKVLRANLVRGSVQAHLELESEHAVGSMEVDSDAVAALAAVESLVAAQAPYLQRMSTADLLNWPGVVLSAEPSADANELKCLALRTLKKAVSELQHHRFREGQGLAAAISGRLDAVHSLLRAIRAQAQDQSEFVRNRLAARVKSLSASVDPARIEQEVALVASRADICEELDRLDLHLAEFRKCLSGPPPHGKRLGFLVQELQREASTVGAKILVPDCAPQVVDLKLAVDQIREQAANLE